MIREQGVVVGEDRTPSVIATFRDIAERNLDNLEQLLKEYFEDGAGKPLSPEKRSFVVSRAKRLTFKWSGHGIIDYRKFDEDERVNFKREYDTFEQEKGIKPHDQQMKDLELLQLTEAQENGLKRRAWVLAEKAILPIN